jgi:hypothetical protein
MLNLSIGGALAIKVLNGELAFYNYLQLRHWLEEKYPYILPKDRQPSIDFAQSSFLSLHTFEGDIGTFCVLIGMLISTLTFSEQEQVATWLKKNCH